LLTCADTARNEDKHARYVLAAKRLNILEWISPVDFSSRHEALSRERVEKTGTWLLQSDAFRNWLNGTASNLLFYQGMRNFFTLALTLMPFAAGAGKTFLT
jgi:hypothetical protein